MIRDFFTKLLQGKKFMFYRKTTMGEEIDWLFKRECWVLQHDEVSDDVFFGLVYTFEFVHSCCCVMCNQVSPNVKQYTYLYFKSISRHYQYGVALNQMDGRQVQHGSIEVCNIAMTHFLDV